MPTLGKKYNCYSCHTKFYDLGKANAHCPKCGADQADADDAPVVTTSRSRKVVELPVEDEFEEDESAPAAIEDDAEIEDVEPAGAVEEEEDDDEDEEEEY